MIHIGSLFSGIGGLELGLERGLANRGLQAQTIWQCEIDPFCRAVLAQHWPKASVYHDVRDIGAAVLQRADIICGGFPCQDISSAGSRRGIHGPKSSLFFEFLRVLDGLGDDGPAIVVIENVGRLVKAGLDEVVSGLHARGFTVDATRIRASDVGAPHRRERVFLVGHHATRTRLLARRLLERVADTHALGLQAELRPGAAPTAAVRGGDVADPDAAVRQQQGRQGGSGGTCSPEPGDAGSRGGQAVADASALGHGTGRLSVLDRDLEGTPGHVPDGRRLSVEHKGSQAGSQPELGRAADGVPCGMDGPLFGGGWPAGRDQPQKAGEAPRVAPRVPCATRWRTAALGNAVVPQCAAAVAQHVADVITIIVRPEDT